MIDMIGIGVTTKDRPEVLAVTLEYLSHYMPPNSVVVVSDDSECSNNRWRNAESCEKFLANFKYINNSANRGIAKNKNSCIKALSDCDYLFLFDDDCFPIKEGWAEFVIDCHRKSGVHHFNLLEHVHHKLINSVQYDGFVIEEYYAVGGVFMFITKEVVSKVGAFNKDYDTYGFEHASYTYRVYRSGLHNGLSINLTIKDLQEYIFSIDYASFPNNVNHMMFNILCEHCNIERKSSVDPIETQKSIKNNLNIVKEDCNGPIFREL